MIAAQGGADDEILRHDTATTARDKAAYARDIDQRGAFDFFWTPSSTLATLCPRFLNNGRGYEFRALRRCGEYDFKGLVRSLFWSCFLIEFAQDKIFKIKFQTAMQIRTLISVGFFIVQTGD